jgi:hypothetical protein
MIEFQMQAICKHSFQDFNDRTPGALDDLWRNQMCRYKLCSSNNLTLGMSLRGGLRRRGQFDSTAAGSVLAYRSLNESSNRRFNHCEPWR